METPRPDSNLSNSNEKEPDSENYTYKDHSEQQNDEHHDPTDDEQKHQEEQNEIYAKTLKQSSLDDEKDTKKSPLGSTSRLNSATKRPVSARSTNFQSNKTSKPRSKSSLSAHDPYLRSVNDLKYVGDQFIVGKVDPNLKQPHEIRFLKLNSARLKKLKGDTGSAKNLPQSLSQFMQSKDPKILDGGTMRFLTNDLKYAGNQFKVGKVDPKMTSVFEQRFQKRFGQKLQVLLPDQAKSPRPFTYEELKQMHTTHAIPKRAK